MKKHYLLLFLSASICLTGYSQIKEALSNLKEQAGKMGTAFVNGEYKIFANYTYPLILKSIGGASKMEAMLNKATSDMKAQGMIIGNITFDEPSKILMSGKELQATIAQHTEIKLP